MDWMRRIFFAGLTGMFMLPGAAQPQSVAFPAHAVRVIVPFAAGGPTDITARLIAEKLAAKWGQAVVIENRPGAGGNLGSDIVAKSPPDGYTIALGVTGSHAINTSLSKNMPYHPLRDFEAVTQATIFPNAIVVHPGVPANTLPELIALAKREPGRYSYGSDGNGTASHLGMELLKTRAGINIVHVPYKGSAPMLTDLVGGQIQIGITGLPTVQAYARSGKLKVLAVTTAERVAAAPELATVAEQGYAGFSAAPWAGFFVPKGTPKAVVDKLATDMIAAMRSPDVTQRLADLGSSIVASRPDEFRAFVAREIETWAEAVKVSGAQVD
jgi:tripartite-type tricarboxylate transporter receptor subunit TctC